MKIAIMYKSLTGNTKLIAEAIRTALRDEVIYCGEPKEDMEADLYFVGSWTDKGMCCEEVLNFLKALENKKIAYFGTAGFGGSEEYYKALKERVLGNVSVSNQVLDVFFCQGKMPMSVRSRYVKMLQEHPEDRKLEVSLKNFDDALSHPDQKDVEQTKIWAEKVRKNAGQ